MVTISKNIIKHSIPKVEAKKPKTQENTFCIICLYKIVKQEKLFYMLEVKIMVVLIVECSG